MGSRIKNFKAITLVEIMVVVLVIGIMAAFAVPSYQKSLILNNEKAAVLNLKIIKQALEAYRAENGAYWNTNNVKITDLSVINQNLDIHIIPQDSSGGVTYFCQTTVSPDSYTCGVDFTGVPFVGGVDFVNSWSVGFANTDALGGQCCSCMSVAACPSCLLDSNGGCSY